MAGPDTKLSDFIATAASDPTGGYIHIILPDGGGGYDSYAIAASVFASTDDRVTDKVVNQSTDRNDAFDAGTKLESIDFEWVSGTPLIKIGTTPSGTEMSLAELTVPNNDYLALTLNKIFAGTTTVYISISGGVVNVNFNYRTNYF